MKPSRLTLALIAVLFLIAVTIGSLHALDIVSAQGFVIAWWAMLLTLAMVAAVDAWQLGKIPSPRIERHVSGNLSLTHWSEIRLRLFHDYSRPVVLQVFDHVPEGMRFQHLPQLVSLRPGEHTDIGYRVYPVRRGHFRFIRCEIELPSPMRLWRQRRYLACHDETRVYPDFIRIYGGERMAVDHWLSRIGIHSSQRRGLGMEFHQLREFRDGDSLRQIDWKATARKGMPIAREYQDERDQQILLLLDCGRRMRSQDGHLSHFDHALNASLLMAYVALRHGDAVGVMTFAGESRFLPPAKGSAQLHALLNTLYDLETTQRPADFSQAIQTVLSRQHRRALVVLITNLRDEDDEELVAAVKRLNRRHRVLITSLREEVLDDIQQTQITNYQEALTYTGAIDYLHGRQTFHEKLIRHGLSVLDVLPSSLGPALVTRYLNWKKAGVI